MDYNKTKEAQETFKGKRKPKNPITFKLQLNDEQKTAKSKILNNVITVVKGKAGSGKANWIKTPIITPDGYKLMEEIKKGDEVISEEGKPVIVLDTFPQGVQKIYKITFSDKSTTHCTEDHLWNVINRQDLHLEYNRKGKINKKYKKYQTLPLKDILNKGLKSGKRDKWYIPLTSPVLFNNEIKLKLDPYVMGCLLGDGCFISTPSITTADKEILDYFKQYFMKLGLNVTPSAENSISYYISQGITKKVKFEGEIYNSVEDLYKFLKISRITYYKRINKGEYIVEEIPNPLTQILKEYDLYNKNSFNKHIPNDYLKSTIEDRISILQGLLDTDGWVQKIKSKNSTNYSSSIFYCTTSETLKNNIITLVNSLGGICSSRSRMGKYKIKGGKKYKETSINFIINIKFKNPEIEEKLFRLKRKQELVCLSKNIINRSISKVEYVFDDEAKCILVDSPTHLYLTDDYIVTHNSLLAANVALDLLFSKEIEKIIITRPTVLSGEEIGFLPGGINEKLAPFTTPVYENMYRLYVKEKIEKCVELGEIEILPVSFMRGRNFTDSLVIVDEAQNLTDPQIELLLTRICHGSKMIFCGDSAQIDLKNKKDSGYDFLCKNFTDIKGFEVVTLLKNHRHEIVDSILNCYSNYRS